MEEAEKKDWFSKFFTIVVPFGLIVATVVGIIIHVVGKPDESQDIERRQPRTVSEAEVTDLQQKLGVLLGDRNVETEAGRNALRGAQAFVAGTLSPENAGYAVELGDGVSSKGFLFRPVTVTLEGKKRRDVVTVFNVFSGELDAAADTAATLAVAQAMAAERPPRSLRFVFLTGLEGFPLSIGRRSDENVKGFLWVGTDPPEGALTIDRDSETAFVTALNLRAEIDELLYR